MDRISRLSDDLLVKILLFLPTKVAASTSILSKRWEHFWMWLPKLEFDDTSYSESESECNRLQCFINRNLPLHKAPVIESLSLKFSMLYFESEDVNRWIVIAVSRHVRELEISYPLFTDNPNILPSSLYACESLVVLKLENEIFLDVPPTVRLPSLKTLKLQHVVYSNEESLQRLLSVCPILEHLVVALSYDSYRNVDNMSGDFLIDGFVITTPSLKYFKLEDETDKNHACLVENVPKLREAYVDVDSGISESDIKSLIRSITSVKSLTLCVKYNVLEDAVDVDGSVFNHLEHLKLCVCQEFDILVGFLKHCPNLRKLDYCGFDDHNFEFVSRWEKPTMVPECILSNLQILNWSNFFGSQDEKNIAAYILKNATCLKTVIFRHLMIDFGVPKLKMIKELANSHFSIQ